jgi:hypothetical protein
MKIKLWFFMATVAFAAVALAQDGESGAEVAAQTAPAEPNFIQFLAMMAGMSHTWVVVLVLGVLAYGLGYLLFRAFLPGMAPAGASKAAFSSFLILAVAGAIASPFIVDTVWPELKEAKLAAAQSDSSTGEAAISTGSDTGTTTTGSSEDF